jgi:hypothetical protein
VPQPQGINLAKFRRQVRELERALENFAQDIDDGMVRELRAAGELVRAEAAARFAAISPSSAAGFRVGVRQSGVRVYQSKKKVTGKRPDFGALQMTRALIPARGAREDEIVRRIDHMLDRAAAAFNRGQRLAKAKT